MMIHYIIKHYIIHLKKIHGSKKQAKEAKYVSSFIKFLSALMTSVELPLVEYR